MKLATYQDGSRDGQLVVVSRDLALAHYATATATRLQQVLDDWNFLSPQLQDLSVALNQGRARHAFAFDARQCLAPLPRAYQWAEALAYVNHRVLLRKANGAETPNRFFAEPLLHQRCSDDLLGPTDSVWFGDAAGAIDFSAGLAVITGDVAMGASPGQALDGVRLLMLANAWRLGSDSTLGPDLPPSLPAGAFSPVAITPDELGEAWTGGRLHASLHSACNGKKVGLCETGPEMTFHFGQLISHLAKTRRLRAGAIVSTGPVSNADAARGYHCIAEKRARETLAHGAPRTGYLVAGDALRIEMKGRDGLSLFGVIEQQIAGPLTDRPDATAAPA